MSEVQSDQNSAPARGRSVRGDRALDTLEFRSRTTGDAAAARSRLVRRLRIILPLVAVGLIGLFIFNTQSNSVDQAFLEDFTTMTATTEELRMANPRFAGIDDEGKPFEITADAAHQDPATKDIIELEMPKAIQGDEETTSIVTADTGLYRSEENILELRDRVTLEHDIGAKTYVLRAPAATVSIKDQIVTSTVGVGAEGPDGDALKADRMTAYRADGRVVFEGNVSMRIYPKADAADETGLLPANGEAETKDEDQG